MLRKYFHSGSYLLISSRPNPVFILRDICHTKVRFCFHLKSRLRFGCFCLSDSHFLPFDISCKKNIFWIEIKFFSIRWLSDRKRIASQLKSTWNHEVFLLTTMFLRRRSRRRRKRMRRDHRYSRSVEMSDTLSNMLQ